MKHTVEIQPIKYVALIGNPNSGKTTLFNALTGLRQKVGNYPGVTVEKKEGKILFENEGEVTVLDLPGTYSLIASSPDEHVAVDVLLGRVKHTPVPDAVICVVDASNLERNLYLVSQIIDHHLPTVIALNMIDVAESAGITIDARKLSEALGVPVIPTIAKKGTGTDELKRILSHQIVPSTQSYQWRLPAPVQKEVEELTEMLSAHHRFASSTAHHEAMVLLSSSKPLDTHHFNIAPEILAHVRKDYEKLDFLGVDRFSIFIESRYQWIRQVCAHVTTKSIRAHASFSDKVDAVLTHKFWGVIIFFTLMSFMFQMIFSWAEIPMNLIGGGFAWLGHAVSAVIPAGDFHDLMINGVISGVGAVVTFLPQILLLFFFLSLLEDSGYMARAAYVMDRIMNSVGLRGKSFIPMLSSFACAIPGIMATRTIENPKDRLVTILVSPLMSCSARLPVYALLIAAFIPSITILGLFSLPGLVLISLYVTGLVAALAMAWVFKKTLMKGQSLPFLMELPPYKMPSLKSTGIHMWERGYIFLKKAGTIILGISIMLWFLATYPKLGHGTPSEKLGNSFVGRAGHFIEPAIKPLGFDWKIGIGLLSSLLQREVFVSTMGTIYNIQDDDAGSMRQAMIKDINPETGKPVFSALTAICIMVYYVLAMQCLSTLVVVKRETNSWKWPVFQFAYMSALAYIVTFAVYRVGMWLAP
jgi:ferrous iron transport protein B